MKLDSSVSSLSSGYRTTSTAPFGTMPSSHQHPSQQRPNGHAKPANKPTSSNLFIPRKQHRRPAHSNAPSQPNTPKPANISLNGAKGPAPASSSAPNSHVNSPRPTTNTPSASQSQPKSISQEPPPLDYPFFEFDLLTGDVNGPNAPSGFNPSVDWNIFKFHRIPGNKTINTAFEFPIKLNRKNYKYLETGMDVDEDEEMGDPSAPNSTAGPTGSGLLEGMDLQDLKNVIVPGSASQIGNPSVKQETPGAGPSFLGGMKGIGKNDKLVPLKGPDGQQVIGPDGQPVMVPAGMAAQVKGGRLPFIPGMMPDHKGKKGGAQKAGGKGAGAAGSGKPGDAKAGEGRKRGGKKTRQVYMIPEHTRKLRKEERYPWLWEDASGKEIWEGRRVERNRVKMQLLQVCKDGNFRWYPAKKHYMFTKLPTWRVPNAEEANERFEKDQRRRNPMYFAENTPHHAGFQRAFRQHAQLVAMEDRKTAVGSTFSGEAIISGTSRLRLVDRGRPASAFEREDADDIGMDNEDVKKEILREKEERDQEIFGMEGDMDEMEYEDDVADDDEKVHADGMEEEEKEYEERLKREWRQANKTEVEVADRAITGSKPRLGKEGRRIKKMLRGQDKTGELYESDDDDKDPYASEEESDSESDLEQKERIEKEKAEKEKAEKAREEEEERLKELLEEKTKEKETTDKEKKGKASKNDNAASKNSASGKPGGNDKGSASNSRGGSPKPRPGGKGGSRAGSPAMRSTPGPSAPPTNTAGGTSKGPPGPGAGNAMTAMRATSPGSPKPRPPMSLNPGSTRMSSPAPSGASTPVPGGTLKRKAESQSGSSTPGPRKRQKTASPTPSGSAAQAPTPSNSQPNPQANPPSKKKKTELFPGCLTQEMVVTYLREREAKGLKTQTKDAIERFKPMWAGAGTSAAKEGADVRNKELLTHWIKKVANLVDGTWLTLR